MGSERIRWKHSAAKERRGLERDAIAPLVRAVGALSDEPYPPGSRKLRGSDRTYRIRVGDYRLV